MDELLDQAFALTERLGFPLVVAAWVTVFSGVVAMAVVLRRRAARGVWGWALLVGGVGLAPHLLDYFVTLRITPDLSLEANPIWKLALAHLGLAWAKAYGLTGKVLVSVLSAQLFAWYLAQRDELFPAEAASFAEFVGRLGAGARHAANIRSFFAYAFALFGPYFFYVTLLNVTGETSWAAVLPGPIPAIAVYLLGVAASYFALAWRAFRKARRPS